jgi:hypothetical protein
MSHNKAVHRTDTLVSNTWRRARQAAVRAQPAAARAMPVVKRTRAAVGRQADGTRAWAAPRVERTGQALRDTVAPKVADMLSAAARRLEPASPRPKWWRKLAGTSAIAAAVGTAVAAVRRRKLTKIIAQADEAETADAATSAETRNGSANTSDGQVSSSHQDLNA